MTSNNKYPDLSNFPTTPGNKNAWPWVRVSALSHETFPVDRTWPKISVVTPSFNQGQFIEETIRSVLLQNYPNLEFIIIDGGSTDNTLEIIRKFESWITYWVSEPDRGQSNAINKGIEKATGEILFWLNSDDIVLPGAFRRVVEVFINNPTTEIVCGQARIIDVEGNIIGSLASNFTTWEELATNPQNSIRQISTFFRRSLFREYGEINENLHIAMDNELIVRLTEKNKPLTIQDFVTAYRVHEQAKTTNQLLTGYKETDRIRLTKLEPKLRALYRKRSAKNWQNLSENPRYTRKQRLECLWRAGRIRPGSILTRPYWSAIKKIFKEGVKY